MTIKLKELWKKNGEIKLELIANSEGIPKEYFIPDYDIDCQNLITTYDPENFHTSNLMTVGDKGTLARIINHKNDEISYELVLPEEGEFGLGGNMDRSIKRIHGWRGTSNDVARYAEGVREVLSVEPRRRGYGFVVILSEDLMPEEE